jgi:hypothetical protein
MRHHASQYRHITGAVVALLLATSLVVSTQGQLPAEPAKQFGASVTGAFEGWFDHNGARGFLVGYMNRNRAVEVDIPIGSNNRIEPGGPDLGQPTHFLTGRQIGMFVVSAPAGFGPQQQFVWSLTINGRTTTIPLRLNPDYTISPFTIEYGSQRNTPPVIRFDGESVSVQGPSATAQKPSLARTTSVAQPLEVVVWAEDDGTDSTATGAPQRGAPPAVRIGWSKFRGPGAVISEPARPVFETVAGGNANQAFRGKSTTRLKFSEPGEYMVQLTANDYSGPGGDFTLCCWTNTIVKVTVTR